LYFIHGLLLIFILAAELGDYHSEDHAPGYLSQLPLIPGQNEEMEKKVAELHKLHKYAMDFIFKLRVIMMSFENYY